GACGGQVALPAPRLSGIALEVLDERPGGELRAGLPGAVVPGPQGLVFSQDMQPPAAPQIVKQRCPDSWIGYFPTLIIAALDPAANRDSLFLNRHFPAPQTDDLAAPHPSRDVEQEQRIIALAHQIAGPGLGSDDIKQSEDLLLGQSLGAAGLVGFRSFRMGITDRVGLEILAKQRVLHRPPEKRREMADPRVDGRLRQPL